jgi:hypothetical protein
MVMFRKALVALVPTAEAAGIGWRNGVKYDPWEGIERALFDAFVRSALSNISPPLPPAMPIYGMIPIGYGGASFLTDRNGLLRGRRLALVELETATAPFDTARFVALRADRSIEQQNILIPFALVDFALSVPSGDTFVDLDRIEYLD